MVMIILVIVDLHYSSNRPAIARRHGRTRAWHRGVNTRGGWKARFLCASYSAADAARISVGGRREPERRRSAGRQDQEGRGGADAPAVTCKIATSANASCLIAPSVLLAAHQASNITRLNSGRGIAPRA